MGKEKLYKVTKMVLTDESIYLRTIPFKSDCFVFSISGTNEFLFFTDSTVCKGAKERREGRTDKGRE